MVKIKHGLISADSHGNVNPATWTGRMSASKWGELIPHIVQVDDAAVIAQSQMPPPYEGPVDRWLIYGEVAEPRGVCNAPAVQGDEQRRYLYQRWEDVPAKVYDPVERLRALDEDGLDGEVLFPNSPVLNLSFSVGSGDFELDCIRAHNDEFADWREVSDRYTPLALVPYLCPIEDVVEEVERSVARGHRGVLMLAEPSQNLPGLHHFNDSYWYPLWECCQHLDIPVHWHANGGLKLNMPLWGGYSRYLGQAIAVAAGFSSQAQFIPNLIFSGVLERYPRLQFVCAEAGLGWVNYILEGCDHEWERRHLWTEGLTTPPSELFRRQVHVTFWYEQAGMEMRHQIGVRNIMFETDYPHTTSTYPNSRQFAERSLQGVPEDERELLCWRNAANLYHMTVDASATPRPLAEFETRPTVVGS